MATFFFSFETLPYLFPPTFKVQRGSGYVYKQQRTPSYTDCILYKSADGFVRPLAHEPRLYYITSDHKPIRGAFSIVPNEEILPRNIKGRLSLTLRNMQGFNLPEADRNGFADPFVMRTWELIDFEVPKMKLGDRIRRFYNRKYWPRTNHVSRSLNPEWKDETIVAHADNPEIHPGALLHVIVVDYDALLENIIHVRFFPERFRADYRKPK
eukprot:scaffold4726_cov128-Cylindrotheca_fusiformis.AAC.2